MVINQLKLLLNNNKHITLFLRHFVMFFLHQVKGFEAAVSIFTRSWRINFHQILTI